MKPVKIKCPYCGCPAILRPASYVHGDRAKEKYLYVCAGYPKCDAYVSIHRGTLIPKGTLAKGDLRHSRIEAHKAMALLGTSYYDAYTSVSVDTVPVWTAFQTRAYWAIFGIYVQPAHCGMP